MKYTLGKDEKLKSKKLITLLFSEGKRLNAAPLQLMYVKNSNPQSSEFPVKIAFSVPKRHFKLAVHRNRVKRVMREVYRKNKYLFIENITDPYLFMLIYNSTNEVNFAELEESLKNICHKFIAKTQSHEKNS